MYAPEMAKYRVQDRVREAEAERAARPLVAARWAKPREAMRRVAGAVLFAVRRPAQRTAPGFTQEPARHAPAV